MKLTVSAAPAGGTPTDHLLDVPEDATVADLGSVLGAEHLYLGDQQLDPDATLGASGIREGVLLGVDAPATEGRRSLTRAWSPPATDAALVEVRHVSGPGAGHVWQLGPGSHEIGTDRGCALRLDGGGAPERGTWITIAADGGVSFRLPEDADPDRCGLRSLTPPPPVDPETGTPLTAEEPAGTQDGGPGGHSVAPPPPGPDGQPAPPPLPPVHQLPEPDDGEADWPVWADLSLGDHLLRLSTPFEPDAAINPSPDGLGVEYNRPPRIAPHLDAESMKMAGPPGKRGNRPFPFLMLIAPLVMGLVMVSLFRTFFFVVFVFFTPIMAIGNWLMSKRSGRKQYEEQLRLFRLRRAALELEVRNATVAERVLRNDTFPDPASLLLTATGPGHQLWERRRRDPDHLALRVGTIARASLKRITDSARESNHTSVHWRLADVPYCVEMTQLGVVGITGPGAGPRRLACWAVAQSAVLHSPRDLRIVVLTSNEHADSWSWVRWLPHLRPDRPGAAGTVISVGNDPESTAHRVNELIADIKARTDAASSALGRTLMNFPDTLVILDGSRRLRDVPGIVEVLTAGPGVRIFSVCLDERERLLPEECVAVITTSSGDAGTEDKDALTVRISGVPTVEGIRADMVTAAWCEEIARAIAPVRDVTVDADSGLPGDVRLLPLLDQEPPNPQTLLYNWARRPASTSFTLGQGYEGPLRIDLVRDGPHGLIGGTTGSGKSELLQTMIASLAAANRPDELAFVLVDYKGGSAFRECAQLPHTLGMITDLDGHLVQRALASLEAELRRREQLLADVEAKDHTEYRLKRARDPRLPALPRLLLVIDEFATLVRELPEFVPGLISLAQRGRSLGLHLILATQRPGGSVNNEIKANTNLRIALRVTDRSESQDIINNPDAAAISAGTPGRALLRRGHNNPTPFQTAWVGAERTDSDTPQEMAVDEDGPDAPAPVRTVRAAELTWSGMGRPTDLGVEDDDLPESERPIPVERPTDLLALVQAITTAAHQLPDYTEQPSPWLPPLSEQLRLDELPPTEPPETPGGLPLVPYGLLDLPEFQDRRLGSIDFATFGHLYVIGAPRTGRTQVLRTVAGSAAMAVSSADLHIYGIDAAGGGLAALETLPHCGAVVDRHDTERLERLVARLVSELTSRQRALSQHSCSSLTELRAKLPKDQRPAHLLLLIDGWDALSGMIDDYDGGRMYTDVIRLLREGQAAGLHVIATSERLLLGGRLAAHNDRRLLLRQTDPSDYHLVGMARGKVPSHVPPGRGWMAPAGIETQIGLLPGDRDGEAASDQGEAVRAIGRRVSKRDSKVPQARRPFRIGQLPGLIGFTEAMEQLPAEQRRPLWALLGIGGDAAAPLGYDFASGGGSFLVAGPPRSGRSTTLAAMSVSLLLGGTSLVVITPRDSQLRRLGVHELAKVMTDTDPSAEELSAALDAVEGRPVVVVVDDADMLANCRADRVLRAVATSGRDQHRGLLLAGPSESMSSLGWMGAARRSRSGILLGPKSIGEGDLIGSRLSSEQMRSALPEGRGWTAGPSGHAIAVQVPLTVLDG
ncbi:FtsK/SpoIIIE domain-containing protein [Streptomyces xiamenensis]|uniref:FtsK/SpoIIIE domain-containing protein n=1 Tax=Streptomyces xiamenensis TaxID=408015 RepID=UPI0034441D18